MKGANNASYFAMYIYFYLFQSWATPTWVCFARESSVDVCFAIRTQHLDEKVSSYYMTHGLQHVAMLYTDRHQ